MSGSSFRRQRREALKSVFDQQVSTCTTCGGSRQRRALVDLPEWFQADFETYPLFKDQVDYFLYCEGCQEVGIIQKF